MMEVSGNPDPDSPEPWFSFDIDTVTMTVGFTEANGLASAEWTEAGSVTEQAIKDNSRHQLSLSSEKPGEVHILAVATDGAVEFAPRTETRGVYYAHLAWYYPGTGEVERINFVE